MKKRYIPIIGGLGCLLLVGGILIGMNLNKNSKNNKNNTNDDPRYIIYLKAVDAGYNGSYEDWLLSIRGDEVELRVADNYIQMKYKQSSQWNNLISLDALKGSNGKDGVSIKSQLQVSDGYIQYKSENETIWNNLIAISDLTGDKGEKLELNVDNGFINYKYESDTDWTGLIEISTLTGSNGKEVTMSVDSDYIVWKYVGDVSWNNLISLDTLKGDKGDKGERALFRVEGGYLQYKYESDDEWIPLCIINSSTETFSVNFNAGAETIIQEQLIPYGGKINKPTDPTLEGFVFDGWYCNNEPWLFSGCVVTEDIVLEAKWHEYYTEGLDFVLQPDGTYGVSVGTAKLLDNIVIPSVYNSKSVSFIYESGFADCSNLESITIPYGITEIGDNAFSRCSKLADLSIPNSVITLGKYCFYGCISLTSVTIPDSIQTISEGCFFACTKLSEIHISTSVNEIKPSAFQGCTAITRIDVDGNNSWTCSTHKFYILNDYGTYSTTEYATYPSVTKTYNASFTDSNAQLYLNGHSGTFKVEGNSNNYFVWYYMQTWNRTQ